MHSCLHVLFRGEHQRVLSKTFTYSNDDEVQPTPGVREVMFESIGKPFEEHLKQKDNGEHLVHIFQNESQYKSVLQVNIFKRLKQ